MNQANHLKYLGTVLSVSKVEILFTAINLNDRHELTDVVMVPEKCIYDKVLHVYIHNQHPLTCTTKDWEIVYWEKTGLIGNQIDGVFHTIQSRDSKFTHVDFKNLPKLIKHYL